METVDVSVTVPEHGPMVYMHLVHQGDLVLVTVVERPSGFSAMLAGCQGLPDALSPSPYTSGLPSLKAVEAWIIEEAAMRGVVLSAVDTGSMSFTAKTLFGIGAE